MRWSPAAGCSGIAIELVIGGLGELELQTVVLIPNKNAPYARGRCVTELWYVA